MRILGRRHDGFHNLESLMLNISLFDELLFAPREQGIELTVEGAEVPAEAQNLVWKAAERLTRVRSGLGGVKIKLQKRIPLASGLGGGSADAAATLVALNQLWQLELTRDELTHVGQQLGKDVPFFLSGGLAAVKGTGEQVEPLEFLPAVKFLLLCPQQGISTEQAYEQWSNTNLTSSPWLKGAITAWRSGRLKDIEPWLFNSFEEVLQVQHPFLREVKERMTDAGLGKALLSGSGSALFVPLHPDEDISVSVKDLKAHMTLIEVVHPQPRGVEIVD